MEARTRTLWAKQNQHEGDRERMFRAVAATVEARTVLYPGSHIDIAASVVWPDVTYVDSFGGAAKFFADHDGVDELLDEMGAAGHEWRFIGQDYTSELDLPDASFDLLISLYAGLVSEACTRHLRVGGVLLVNGSHGDAAMASLNPAYEHIGVVVARAGDYSVRTSDLDGFLEPKKPTAVSRELILESGRGVAYRKPSAAHLFRRIA